MPKTQAREDVDVDAALAAYSAWLGRQPLATRSREAYLAQVRDSQRCEQLDGLLVTDPELGVARLVWLGDGATSASSDAAKAEVAKLAYLEDLGADRLDLSAVPPERLRQLARIRDRARL